MHFLLHVPKPWEENRQYEQVPISMTDVAKIVVVYAINQVRFENDSGNVALVNLLQQS